MKIVFLIFCLPIRLAGQNISPSDVLASPVKNIGFTNISPFTSGPIYPPTENYNSSAETNMSSYVGLQTAPPQSSNSNFLSTVVKMPASDARFSPWDPAKRLTFGETQSIYQSEMEDSKITSYSQPIQTVVSKKSSLIKVTPLDSNLPNGHPAKCNRPGCGNRKFINKDGTVFPYCSRACGRAESLKKP